MAVVLYINYMKVPGFTTYLSLSPAMEHAHLVTKNEQHSFGIISPMMKKQFCLVCDSDGSHKVNCDWLK